MRIVKRSAIVAYSDQQMFDLVNDIAAYPEFLPWCRSSEVLQRSEHEITARVDIGWSGIHKSFTTRNELAAPTKIEMHLVEGPFSHFYGIWEFKPLQENACNVSLDLEFDIEAKLMSFAFKPVFAHIATTLVEAFCKRAKQKYQ